MDPKKQRKKRKPFYDFTPEQEVFIKQNYGRKTKSSICRALKVGYNKLEAYLRATGIKADWEPTPKTQDLTGWQFVPVPGVGNPVLRIPPGKDPEEAKRRYLERQARKKNDKK